jgi:hypothetical protein
MTNPQDMKEFKEILSTIILISLLAFAIATAFVLPAALVIMAIKLL